NGRFEHQEDMDQGIEQWTQTLDKYELSQKCQAAGVRGMPVQSSEDRVEHDPQLRERGMYTEMEHPMLGTWKFQNAPFKLSKSPAVMHRPPPMLGQHNPEVLQDLLGLTPEEVREGYQDGTLWPQEMPLYPYLQEALP
ncbi:MAG: CoA transferase, partial [Chloroflexi bacterium]|nr:CoA transferase [Chloroflexota bacterium]